MAKPTFDHCCCCVELRLGCLIWGYLELASAVYSLVRLSLFCRDFEQVIQILEIFLEVPKEQFKETEEVIRYVGIAFLIFSCLLWGIKVFFNIVFIRGLHLNNRAHVGAYLLYTFIFIIVNLIQLFVIIIMLAKLLHEIMIVVVVILIIIIHAFMAYFWLVIRSQYCNMEIKPKQRRTKGGAATPPPLEMQAVPNSLGNRSESDLKNETCPEKM